MTISLDTPSAGYIGQGHNVGGTTDQVGAYAYFIAEVYDPLLAFVVCAGSAAIGGASGGCQLGIENTTFGRSSTHFQGLPAGNAVTLRLTFLTSGFATIDTQDFATFFHDPVSGLAGLIESELGTVASLTPAQEQLLEQAAQNSLGGTFKFPLIGLLTPVPYGGNPANGGTVYDLPPPLALQVVGISWEVVTAPAYTGGDVGVITDVRRRIVQFVVFHSLFGGATFADQIFESHAVTGSFFFDSPDPTGVSLFAYPGYQVNVSYLVIL